MVGLLVVTLVLATEGSLSSLAFGVVVFVVACEREWPLLFWIVVVVVIISKILLVVVITVTKTGTIQKSKESE